MWSVKVVGMWSVKVVGMWLVLYVVGTTKSARELLSKYCSSLESLVHLYSYFFTTHIFTISVTYITSVRISFHKW